jgi:hypothetical protein
VADYAELQPERIKHLEIIWAIVSRLAGNSSSVKFFGLAITRHQVPLVLAGLLPIIVFYGLDVCYLR